MSRKSLPRQKVWVLKDSLGVGCVVCNAAKLDEEEAGGVVDHPPHYTSHPSGIECIQVTEHMSFCVGSAIKYLWRANHKGTRIEDLRKARWYVDREIARFEKETKP